MAELSGDWEAQAHKWQETRARIDRKLAVLKVQTQENGGSPGALMVLCGIQTEASFRQAMVNILEISCGVKVRNETLRDDAGEVFGRPDQVELDVIIQNGLLILCEIKSSMSKPDMVIFERKAAFYEKRHGRKAARKLVISPMVEDRARTVAATLGIEVYSYAEDVTS